MVGVYTVLTTIKMDRKSTMVLTSVTKTIRIIFATGPQHRIKYTRLPLNIISKAGETWDVQERDGHCEVRTGQWSNTQKDDDDEYLHAAVLHHKPVLPQRVKKFPTLYENRRVITVLLTAHH
jgi:hypothetical protein